jgi:hypothetical protein
MHSMVLTADLYFELDVVVLQLIVV